MRKDSHRQCYCIIVAVKTKLMSKAPVCPPPLSPATNSPICHVKFFFIAVIADM